ncbi:hypothetical protein BJY00DRAFT_292496 [Aspergillus carlsbadensis]|nr:hypothetical protein BJY00DRAFT_292496 [Aspergillus carlsbadensis]
MKNLVKYRQIMIPVDMHIVQYRLAFREKATLSAQRLCRAYNRYDIISLHNNWYPRIEVYPSRIQALMMFFR